MTQRDQPSTSYMSDDDEDTDILKCDYLDLVDGDTALDVNHQSTNENVEELSKVLKQSSDLLPRAKKTAELYLDDGEENFDLFSFAELVRSYALRNGEPSCEALDSVVYNSIPDWTPMIGYFDTSVVEKPAEERRKHTKDMIVSKEEPEKDLIEGLDKGFEDRSHQEEK